jgi:nitrite reductase (NADH) small subunit
MKSQKICSLDDLVANSGVCALINNRGVDQQVALFYLPATEQKVFALGNWDPIGQANVLSRGIVGSLSDQFVVASPLYKQHFSLSTGQCLEQDASVPIFPVIIAGNDVMLAS